MLPKMNGRDLAKKLKSEVSESMVILLMSGIYKDKIFVRDALQSTGAVAFLTKPFDLDHFLAEVETHIKDLLDVPIAPMWSMMAKHDISPKERMRAVDEMDMVHGFELPWVYSLLMYPKVSGHLNIISADGDVCGVGFLNGEIVQVYQEDLKSYFGVLMVENGFISQAELDEVMTDAGKSKKLGERLVEANLLSPHAIEVVMEEQQGLRLSKSISNTSVKVNFIEIDDMRINAHTDRTAFTDLLNDWINSKISVQWLKSFYTPWMRYNFRKGPDFSPHHRSLTIPVVQRVPNILNFLLESETFEQAAAKMANQEDDFFRAMHALVVSRMVRFGEPNSKSDYDAQRERLKKLVATLDEQNHFERLGVNSKAKDSEIKRSYHELAKVLHPDKMSQDAPKDVRELAKQAFERIAKAYATLTDPKLREDYLIELEKGSAQASLQAEQLADTARPLLTKGDFTKARDLLEEAIKLAPPTTEMRLLYMWARMKVAGADRDLRVHQWVKDEISKIPPEERHNALFFFVRGLHMKIGGDVDGARKSFEHVISDTPDFIDARRELNTLTAAANKPVDLLKGDLKDVVGLLFKKKK
jgi:DnaJ-domain-containing protein 1/CheY-like chemotaxis protein